MIRLNHYSNQILKWNIKNRLQSDSNSISFHSGKYSVVFFIFLQLPSLFKDLIVIINHVRILTFDNMRKFNKFFFKMFAHLNLITSLLKFFNICLNNLKKLMSIINIMLIVEMYALLRKLYYFLNYEFRFSIGNFSFDLKENAVDLFLLIVLYVRIGLMSSFFYFD